MKLSMSIGLNQTEMSNHLAYGSSISNAESKGDILLRGNTPSIQRATGSLKGQTPSESLYLKSSNTCPLH